MPDVRVPDTGRVTDDTGEARRNQLPRCRQSLLAAETAERIVTDVQDRRGVYIVEGEERTDQCSDRPLAGRIIVQISARSVSCRRQLGDYQRVVRDLDGGRITQVGLRLELPALQYPALECIAALLWRL